MAQRLRWVRVSPAPIADLETLWFRRSARRSKKQPIQLELFPVMEKSSPNPPQKLSESPADSAFPSLAEMECPMTDEELLADFEKKFPL
jgi:hypothetical protein